MDLTPTKLATGADGRLAWIPPEGNPVPVNVRVCFPWAAPGCHLSLRDDAEKERAYVASPEELDSGSRAALERAAAEARFVIQVTRIKDIRAEYELRLWEVETRQGARRFQTKLDDWPRVLGDNSLLVRDVAGDLFHVPPLDALDPASRRHASPFVE